MGRFLQFEDQSRPLRDERDVIGSFFYVLRSSLAIFALGCAVSVVASFAVGDDKFLTRLIALI